jgi:hypothetical protein
MGMRRVRNADRIRYRFNFDSADFHSDTFVVFWRRMRGIGC